LTTVAIILGMLVLPIFPQNERPTTGDTSEDSDEVAVLMKRAEQGNASAQLDLGLMYGNGQGVLQDYTQAARWFREAAEQGNVAAQFNLGVVYSDGKGVPQDFTQAIQWYRRAAEQGNAAAQFSLGVMYDNGRGVPQDYREAARWYRAAAEQGNAAAQHNLGLMYDNGQGVPQDYIQAHMWYNIAASSLTGQDREVPSRNREAIAKKMTSEQIAEAQRLAREWKPETGAQ
jgi:TPR repeat protein